MKRTLSCLLCALIIIFGTLPISALAEDSISDPPQLKSISFRNAEIEGGFSPDIYNYSLTLYDPHKTPSLENYEIDGEAELFITYITNSTKQQTGIIATLEYQNGSMLYFFNYSNISEYEGNNNYLADIQCELGEVSPAINEKDTAYKLYIPNDLEVLRLTPVTQEVGAYCDLPGTIVLNSEQEPILTLNVTCASGEARRYTLKVKRLRKNCEQVKHMIEKDSSKSLLEGEHFYQTPEFHLLIVSVAAAIILLILVVRMVKRHTTRAVDMNEVEFFD